MATIALKCYSGFLLIAPLTQSHFASLANRFLKYLSKAVNLATQTHSSYFYRQDSL